MESLKMILVSLRRNKAKSVFIVFQMSLCCFLFIVFLGESENIFRIFEKSSQSIVGDLFKGMCISEYDNGKYSQFAEHVYFNKGHYDSFSDRDMIDVYRILKNDKRIKTIGRTIDLTIPIKGNTGEMHDGNTINVVNDTIKLIALDEKARDFFNYKVIKGQDFKSYYRNNKNDDIVPILVGPEIERTNPIGSIIEIPQCFDRTTGKYYKCRVIGVLDPNRSLNENESRAKGLPNPWVVVSSGLIFSIRIDEEGNRSNFRDIYFKLNNDNDIEDIKEEVNLKVPSSYVYIKNLQQQLDDNIDIEKKNLSSIRDNIAMITLASFGVIGISFYTLRKRKKEIGIRYCLGCPKKNIILMLLGENIILYFVSIPIGLASAYLITMINDQILIDGWVIGITLVIMAVFMIISILPLVVKLMKLKPIELLKPKE